MILNCISVFCFFTIALGCWPGHIVRAAPVCSDFYVGDRASSVVVGNRFEINRIFGEYVGDLIVQKAFSRHSFIRDLTRLNGDDVFVDFGTGNGAALAGIYGTRSSYELDVKRRAQQLLEMKSYSEMYGWTKFEDAYEGLLNIIHQANTRDIETLFQLLDRPQEDRPRALGISYKMSQKIKETEKLAFLKDRLFEDIPIQEIPSYQLGASFFGVFSYSKKISHSLFKALSRLEPGGKLYIFGMRSRVTKTPLFPDGSLDYKKVALETMPKWLKKNVTGIKVHEPLLPNREAIVIERTSEPLSLPVLEFVTQLGEYSTPPVFVFFQTSERHI